MRHQYAAAGEFQKFRQNLLHQRRILHHIVPNARKLLYLKGDWHLRIDKRRKAIQHLAVPELYRTDLNDAVVHGRESGGLNIKYHKISFKLSLLVSRDDLFQVIHQISFHPVIRRGDLPLVSKIYVRINDPMLNSRSPNINTQTLFNLCHIRHPFFPFS